MEELYKYSQFNIVAEKDGDKVLLYNTNSLMYRYLDKFDFDDIDGKTDIDLGDIPVWLAEEGFIVPTSLDEIQRLKDDIQQKQAQADYMFISIFTTLACNYRCVYCFEKDQLCQTDYMSLETADEIISFIKRQYEKHQFTKPLKIKWFGGEPLLNMEIIRYISNELINSNIEFAAKLYTNGRLLSKEIALELKELHVTDEVVIPIDGLAQTYTSLKCCKEEDFYTVLDNIKACEDILKIIIHINISEASKNDVQPLLDLLRNEYKIKSRIKPVNVAPQNTDIVTAENNINLNEFIESSNIIRDDKKRYIARNYGCEGRHPDYYVIGTQGELYICEHLIGQEQYIVGNIKEQSGRINRTNTIWDTNRIIDDCSNCPILPICLGFCTSQRYIDHIDCEMKKRIQIIKNRLIKIIENKKII